VWREVDGHRRLKASMDDLRCVVRILWRNLMVDREKRGLQPPIRDVVWSSIRKTVNLLRDTPFIIVDA